MSSSSPLDTETSSDPNTESQPLEQTYNLHSINATVTIRQLPSQGLSFQLWPAAATIINLLDRNNTNKTPLFNISNTPLRILELGSGTGVVGIAAAALLSASVTVTDLPHVLQNLEFNVQANAGMLKLHGGEVNVAALAWGDSDEMKKIFGKEEYDVILGSDVVYHDNLYEPLIETLKYFLLGREKKVLFLMGHLKRWKKESGFFNKAKKFFDVEIIHVDTPENGCRVGVSVYQFVSKSNSSKLKL